MTEFKIGDVVRLKTDGPGKLQMIVRDIDTNYGSLLCRSECSNRVRWANSEELELVNRPDPQADIKQAIREVLLSDEFMEAFAAAWMKTPLPITMQYDTRDGERIQSLADYPFGEPTNANQSRLCCGGPEADPDSFGECGHCGNMLCGRLHKAVDSESCSQTNAAAIPGTPAGWKLVGFKQIQDDVKVFDEDGDYWTFGGTNDPGDLVGALMPIFQKTEARKEPAKAQQLADRTLKAIWQANDGGDQ